MASPKIALIGPKERLRIQDKAIKLWLDDSSKKRECNVYYILTALAEYLTEQGTPPRFKVEREHVRFR